MGGRECAQVGVRRQRGAFQFDHGDVDFARRIFALAPDAAPVAIERDRKAGGVRDVVRVVVELDLDAVREVLARLVVQHVATGHQVQTAIALEEETARVGQSALALEGAYAGGGIVYFLIFRKEKPKTKGSTDLDNYDYGDEEDEPEEQDDAEESDDASAPDTDAEKEDDSE